MAELNDIVCFTDDKTIALKRRLVAGDYSSAHSCCHCKIFVVPETISLNYSDHEAFFQTSMQIDEIHRLAADGCRWFALFSNKLNYIAESDEEELASWGCYDFDNFRTEMKGGSVLISMAYEISNNDVIIEAHLFLDEDDHFVSFFGFKQPGI
ncbi:hypothetical protein F4678DRAFT_363357 [Xylaria arbuscula]|nr:hypothetical protein F4678DRAFT_363357 [Xylaria arbuscula]